MEKRCICIAGHANSGKTALGEAILYKVNFTNRLGSIDTGTSILDYMKYERERKYSVSLSVATFKYDDVEVDLIDTPGYLDFQGERISGLSVCDSVVIVVDGSSGLGFTTGQVIEQAQKRGIPSIFYISKLGKESINFKGILEEIKDEVKTGLVPLVVPLIKGDKTIGVVDMLDLKAYAAEGEIDIPPEFQSEIEQYKESMIESISEVDEGLMEKFVEEKEITNEDLKKGLQNGVRSGKIFPVISGDSISLVGINCLLQYIKDILPSPAEAKLPSQIESIDGPTVAFSFKTKFETHVGELNFIKVWRGKISAGDTLINTSSNTEEKINQLFVLKGNERESVNEVKAGSICALVKLKNTASGDTLADPSNPVTLDKIVFPKPVAKIAIEGESEKDNDKISKGLSKLRISDRTLNYNFDSEAKQLILETMGEQHMQFIKSWLEDNFGVHLIESTPGIHYRETIQKKSEGQAKFKKQTGGRGQYGEVYLKVEPLDRGVGVEFEDQIKGGNIPGKYVPSVEMGVREALATGTLACYPVIDCKVIVYDGSYHPVDSSDNAFRRAGSMAVKDALLKASPFLLEPILKIQVVITDEYTGDVMGDLNSKRGKILGIDAKGKFQVINAYVPEKEMFKYSSRLRSLTQGTGTYSAEFAFYERMPEEISKEIIEQSKSKKEE
ncbi:elongation factor G [candidate division WOR-3 bacterium]|nr:elongation factor G [candidate division WOR-3 bacterium]